MTRRLHTGGVITSTSVATVGDRSVWCHAMLVDAVPGDVHPVASITCEPDTALAVVVQLRPAGPDTFPTGDDVDVVLAFDHRRVTAPGSPLAGKSR